jgi:hypothetical protein
MAPDSPSAGASADTTSVAGAGGGERPHDAPEADQASHDPPAASGTEEGVPSRHAAPAHEATGHEAPPGGEHGDAFTGQAAQPDEDHAVPDTPPQAGLKQQLAGLRDQMQAQVDERLQAAETRHQASLDNLKAEYEAGKAQDRQQIDDLRTELQALKDERPQPAPDAPGNTGMEADQPRLDDRELPEDQQNPEEPEHQDDRPGLWSNAKSVLYGAVGSTIGLAAADQFMPNVPHSVVDIATGAISLAGLLVPVAREGWKKRKHDNSPTKP